MYVTYIRFFNALTLHKSASHDNCAAGWAAQAGPPDYPPLR